MTLQVPADDASGGRLSEVAVCVSVCMYTSDASSCEVVIGARHSSSTENTHPVRLTLIAVFDLQT